MGKHFKKIQVYLSGDFGSMTDKIKQWVEANGGTYLKTLSPEVTHIIATETGFRKPTHAVRIAMKTAKVVSLEWLEDSLLSKHRRPKREGPYSWKRKLKTERKAAIEQRTIAHREDTEKATEFEDYHVYTDAAGIRYSALLVRPTERPKIRERHMLKMLESDAIPHTYAAHVKYTRGGLRASDTLAPIGSTYDCALRAFQKFFKAKTGVHWAKKGATALKKLEKGVELPSSEGWFAYMPENDIANRPSREMLPNYSEEEATAATRAMLEHVIQSHEGISLEGDE